MKLSERVVQAIRELQSAAVPGIPMTPRASPPQIASYAIQTRALDQYGQRGETLRPNSVATLMNIAKTFDSPNEPFWSPFPDQSLLLQPAPVDISIVVENNDLEQLLSKDGFRLANLSDPVFRHASFYDPPNWN